VVDPDGPSHDSSVARRPGAATWPTSPGMGTSALAVQPN
jgi:hypothetical protein